MATVDDAPAELRHLAERIPADIRERLDPAELHLRLQQVARHQAHIGDMPDAETARGLSQHANAMLKALPFCEVEQRCRELKRSATQVSAAVDSRGFLDAARQLKEDNPQPAIMTHAAQLADSQTDHGVLAASAIPEHRQLAVAAAMIRAQRAGTAPAGQREERSAVDRGETADVTKDSAAESVPFLAKARGPGRATRADLVKVADLVKMVKDAVADSGMREQLDKLAADIALTKAEIDARRGQAAEELAHTAGATSTLGAPQTKMRGNR